MSERREWTAERHAAAWDRCNRATSGPWKWWTSNSHRRLTAEDRQDGGVAYGTKHKDGCGDIVIGEHDMAFIEEARLDLPDALREIEKVKCDLSDIATALNGRLTEATAENERLQRALANHKALLAAAESAGREVCDERDAWKEQAGANAHGCQEQKTFREAAEAERDDARTDIAKAQSLLVETGAPEHMIGRHDEDPRATLREQIGALRHVFWSIATDRGKAKIPNGVPWADAAEEEARRLRADLLLLGALKSAEVAPVIERFRAAFGADVPQAPGLTDDRLDLLLSEAAAIVGMQGPPEMKRAALRGSLLMVCSQPAKVDPPVRHARHDRHCMIGDGVGCSREPGCEVEP